MKTVTVDKIEKARENPLGLNKNQAVALREFVNGRPDSSKSRAVLRSLAPEQLQELSNLVWGAPDKAIVFTLRKDKDGRAQKKSLKRL